MDFVVLKTGLLVYFVVAICTLLVLQAKGKATWKLWVGVLIIPFAVKTIYDLNAGSTAALRWLLGFVGCFLLVSVVVGFTVWGKKEHLVLVLNMIGMGGSLILFEQLEEVVPSFPVRLSICLGAAFHIALISRRIWNE